MRTPTVGALFLMTVGAAAAPRPTGVSGPMTATQIREAIEWGLSAASSVEPDPFDAYFLGGIDRATVTTPFSRVAYAAREARLHRKAFTQSDVTPDMLKPVIRVWAPGTLMAPNNFQGHTQDYTEPVNVTEVWIERPDGSRIEPLVAEKRASLLKDELQGEIQEVGIRAEFPLDALVVGNRIRITLVVDRSIPITEQAIAKLR